MQILNQDIDFIKSQQVVYDDESDDLKYMKGYVNVLKERFSRKYSNDATSADMLQRERDQQQMRNRSVSPGATKGTTSSSLLRYRVQSNEIVEPVLAVQSASDIVRYSYVNEINADELPKANFVSAVKNIFESKTKVYWPFFKISLAANSIEAALPIMTQTSIDSRLICRFA
jgi:hypothetical protein